MNLAFRDKCNVTETVGLRELHDFYHQVKEKGEQGREREGRRREMKGGREGKK